MQIHLINPSHIAFGMAVITPRWLYVLAEATPRRWGDPTITDETLEALDPDCISAGDVVGIGIHTSNALRGYEVGRAARARGAHVVFGGIHATLYPDEAFERGGAHAVVTGDGDSIWPQVIDDFAAGTPRAHLRRGPGGGSVSPESALGSDAERTGTCGHRSRPCADARSTARSARSGARTVRNRASEPSTPSSRRSVELRRMGFRFIALADDNFYPVTLEDLQHGRTTQGSSALAGARGVCARNGSN